MSALDGFKLLNGSHRHRAGYYLLIEIAKRLRKNLREGGTVARICGDEFMMILEGLQLSETVSMKLVKEIAVKLKNAIAVPLDP